MSWGTELWDQFDKVTDHTQKGIEFCDKYAHFARDRAKLEQDYAANLRRLAKNYSPKKGKDDEVFTLTTSFTDTLKEITDIAGQHDLLAESLTTDIVQQTNGLASETKQERKRNMDEAKKLEAGLAQQNRVLEQSKQKYDKAYKDYCKADDIYRAADLNMQLSRAEVDKAKNVSIQRSQTCSDCKATYAQVLEKTNEHRRDYYNKTLPQVFQSLQDMDERRVCKLRDSIKTFADLEKKIQPIVNTCLEGIVTASSKVDHEEDSRRVVDKYKTGFQPPGDIPFEDLNEETRSTGSNPQIHHEKEKRSETMGKNSKARGAKSRSGLKSIFGGRNAEEEREDFGHLNPQQQKKQLNKKIQAIKTSIAKEVAAREAMTKMQDVYSKNPSLGDAADINAQLDENKRKLEELDAELNQFENYLAAAESGNQTPTMQRRNSSGSYASVHSADNVSSTPIQNNGAVQSSSGDNSLTVPQPHVPNTNSSRHVAVDSFDNDSFDEADEPAPALGSATALFPFTATSVGAIDISEQEVLVVVENDTGDGWTRVRKANGVEGFVPTTYIQLN